MYRLIAHLRCAFAPEREARRAGQSNVVTLVAGCGAARDLAPYLAAAGIPQSRQRLYRAGNQESARYIAARSGASPDRMRRPGDRAAEVVPFRPGA